jgi:hypothetical protein
MRRLGTITAIALFLAVPLWAQRGGGGHAGGGFSGGHGGGFSGGHAAGFASHSGGFSGTRSGSSGSHVAGGRSYSGVHPGFSRGSIRVPSSRFSRNPYLHDGFANNRFRGNRGNPFGGSFRDHGFRNNCHGYGCRSGYGYPWGYSGYFDPWWWWNSDSNYDGDYNDNLSIAQQMNQQNLDERQMLRDEEADGDRDAYAPPRAPRAPEPPQPEKESVSIMPDTVLVFRDQRKQEVQNYAIVGQTLWAFAPQRTQKIPLTDLDLAATAKANEDRGVTFRAPSANEAQ